MSKSQKSKKKTTSKKASSTIKPATKKPATFSRNESRKGSSNSQKKAEIILPKKTAEATEDVFETLALGVTSQPTESRIILRDVEKIEPPKTEKKLEKKPKKKTEAFDVKPVKKTTKKPVAQPRLTAKEIKEREIEKAVKAATKLPASVNKRQRKFTFGDFGWKRAVLAVTCVATAVFAVVYFVNLTSTDVSLKVAAMQSGIEASYPSYVPRGYTLSDVTSASGLVKISFKNGDDSFSITEENSSWDSNALLNNYVKEVYEEDYTVVREQGLTLYMGDFWAAWVNGGMVYKLNVNSGLLTKKQIKAIAVSL